MARDDEVSSDYDTEIDITDMSNMFSTFEKMSKLHAQLKEENSRLKSESGTLTEKLSNLNSQCSELEKLRSEFNDLRQENESRRLREEGFKATIASFTNSARALRRIQEIGKHPTDKTGIGFDLNPSSSSQHQEDSESIIDVEAQDLNDELILNAQLRAEAQDRPRYPGLGLDRGKGILHVRTDEIPSQTHIDFTNLYGSRKKK